MEHYRCILYYFVITTLTLITVCNAQDDLDGPSNNPDDKTILLGSTVTLECSVRPGVSVATVSWLDVTDGGGGVLIFFGTAPGGGQKYANFELDSDGASKWDLVMRNVEGDDSGLYACQNTATGESDVAERIVEKPATLITMIESGTEVSTVTVTEGTPSNIVCTSLASIPIINIIWMQQKDSMADDITSAASQTNTSNADLTFDSVSTLEYIFSREFNGGMLTCKTGGQQLAESKEDTAVLNVRYPPEVSSVNYANEVIICNAEANPEVIQYAIIVNYTEVYDQACSGSECKFPYKVTEEDTNIRCSATNVLGMDSADTTAQPGAAKPTTETQPPGTTKSSANGESGSIHTAAVVLGLLLSISSSISSCFFIFN